MENKKKNWESPKFFEVILGDTAAGTRPITSVWQTEGMTAGSITYGS